MELTVSKQQSSLGAELLRFASCAAALLLMTIGFFGMQRSVFTAAASDWALSGIAAMLSGLVIIWLLPQKGKTALAAMIIPAALLIFCAVFFPDVRAGERWLANRILEILQLHREEIFLPYAGAQASARLYAMLPASVAAGALAALIILHVPALAAVLTGAAWVLTGFGWYRADIWLLLFSLGCLAALLRRPLSGCAGKADGALLQGSALILAVSAAITALLPAVGLPAENSLSETRSGIVEKIHALLYEREKQTLPEGDFSGPFRLQYGSDSMLEVEMSSPASLYLRGSAYADYDDEGWKPVSRETADSYAELFYWLHKNGFSGETQLSALAEALDTKDNETVAVTVKATGACRKVMYVPMELCVSELETGSLRDGTVLAEGDTYSYQTEKNMVAEAYELLKALDESRAEPEASEYLRLEESYRDFVYANYMEIPEDCAALLPVLEESGRERMTSYEAKAHIRAYLAGNASYRQSAEIDSGGSALLKELFDRGGNCVHYATAAVLMLRSCGIPARYAEGYIITPETAESSGGSLTLTGQNAHAWAEYYEDGVGWIPFETAPPFIGLMGESEWQWFEYEDDAPISGDASTEADDIKNSGTSADAETPQESSRAEEEPTDQWENRQEKPSKGKTLLVPILLWSLLGILIAALAAAAVISLRHRLLMKRRRALFEDPELKTAITALFADSVALMRGSGLRQSREPLSAQCESVEEWFGGETDYLAMEQLNGEAMFSTHDFTSAQRDAMAEFHRKTLRRFCERLNVFQRFYQHWIFCMY